MKLNRSMALILMTFLGTAVFAWNHAQSKAHKAIAPASRQLAQAHNTGLILTGTIVPMITTPIVSRNLNLAVPLNTWVERGEVIGTEDLQTDTGEMDRARQELMDARSAERRARDRVRQVEEELRTVQVQAGDMDAQEARAKTARFDENRRFEERDTTFRFGQNYSSTVTARDSAETAVDSLRSSLVTLPIKTDELEAKAIEAQAELSEARTRRNAAEVAFERVQGGSNSGPIVSPADGFVVASGQPEGASLGIASDPRQLCAYAMVREADLTAVQVGQESLIVLDAQPAVTFRAKVSAISETPVDWLEGTFYRVTFVVSNPAGASLSSAAMHARMAPLSR